eukprot:Em0017g392a
MSGNFSNCSIPIEGYRTALLNLGIIGGFAAALCSAAVILVVVLKLYRQLIYRLALYQVLGAFVFGLACVLELPLIDSYEEPDAYHSLCVIAAMFILFSLWLKLLFTLGVTFHLFCFVILHKNFKFFEVPYVIASLIVPFIVSVIPLARKSYGPAGAWCWIKNWEDNCPSHVFDEGVVEQFVLWYCPALTVLVVNSVAVVGMTVFLGRMASKKSTGERSQYKRAVNQMLPLAAYPVIYCLLLLPTLAGRAYGASPHSLPLVGFMITDAVCSSAYSLLASITLIVHVCVVLRLQRKLKSTNPTKYASIETEEGNTYKEETKNFMDSFTYYSLPETDLVN